MDHTQGFFLVALVGFVVVQGAVVENPTDDVESGRPTLDIIELADRLDGGYSFLAALEETKLTDWVRNLHGVTVFIPSADAFRAVPEGTRNYFRKHMDRYAELLKYHIVQGQLPSDKLVDEVVYQTTATAHQVPFGARLNIYNHTALANITTYQGAVVNKNKRDYLASNGILHFLDEVVLHVPYQSTLEHLKNDSDMSILYGLLLKTPEALALLNSSVLSHTLFAPNNEAFGKLPNTTRNDLNDKPLYRKRTLFNHITQFGTYFSNGWVDGEKVPTTNWASNLTITKPKDGYMKINGNVEIIVADNSTFNGVVHEIDTVLLPAISATPEDA